MQIAKGLGAQTIAEFVGDAQVLERLRELDVDFGQGYHLGAPQPLAEVLPALPAARATDERAAARADRRC